MFLVLHGINTIFQLALVLCLWVDYGKVRYALAPSRTGAAQGSHKTDAVLTSAKFVVALLVVVELTGFIMAILLRFVIKEQSNAAMLASFDEGTLQVCQAAPRLPMIVTVTVPVGRCTHLPCLTLWLLPVLGFERHNPWQERTLTMQALRTDIEHAHATTTPDNSIYSKIK